MPDRRSRTWTASVRGHADSVGPSPDGGKSDGHLRWFGRTRPTWCVEVPAEAANRSVVTWDEYRSWTPPVSPPPLSTRADSCTTRIGEGHRAGRFDLR